MRTENEIKNEFLEKCGEYKVGGSPTLQTLILIELLCDIRSLLETVIENKKP